MMKSTFAIIIFAGAFVGINLSNNVNPIFNKLHPCPSNHEKAEQALKELLEDERTIENLRNRHDIVINHSSNERIYTLQNELDQDTCKEIISQLDWLENYEYYSFYKVSDYYIIVPFSLKAENEFELLPVTFLNKELKVLAIIINLE